MGNFHLPQTRKNIIILGTLSVIVLIISGVIGGLFAGALATSQKALSATTTQSIPDAEATASMKLTVTMLPSLTPMHNTSTPVIHPSPIAQQTPTPEPSTTLINQPISPTFTITPEIQPFSEGPIVVTTSIQGRPINAYRYGTGDSARALIGAIHGGYEWNTVTLLSRTMELLDQYPEWIPSNVSLYVIPNMNPDGYAAGTDAVIARMNANLVDLNRNWDYQWQMTATHGTRQVKAGTRPFSEPETRGVRDFIFARNIEAVIFYHSAMGVVFQGAETESSLTAELTAVLSEATGYPLQSSIPGQITTGDAIDYLSTVGVAGTEIELTTHAEVDDSEFQRNINGIKAFLLWKPETMVVETSYDQIQSSEWITYVIKEGDTLSALALEFDTTVEQLKYIKGLSENDILYIGAEILVPKWRE